MAAVARERATLWRELAREHGVALTVSSPAGADALAVPGAVDQILDNLLDNALEVAPVGTDIVIEVSADGPHVAVAVTDQGPGMSDADRAWAFDRFWRADAGGGTGIGIGLTIVRDLTEACGGEIDLLRADGGGTRAVLTLDRAPGGIDPVGPAVGANTSAMTARLRARLRRYLRARDPERAEAVEAEVWPACTQEGTEFDGCDDCATVMFTMAHDRMPDPPAGGTGATPPELDAHLLRTLGGLDTAEIARVLEIDTEVGRAPGATPAGARCCPSSTVGSCRRPRRSRGCRGPCGVVRSRPRSWWWRPAPRPRLVRSRMPCSTRWPVSCAAFGVRVPDPEPDRPAGLPAPSRDAGRAAATERCRRHRVRRDGTLVMPGPAATDPEASAASSGRTADGPSSSPTTTPTDHLTTGRQRGRAPRVRAAGAGEGAGWAAGDAAGSGQEDRRRLDVRTPGAGEEDGRGRASEPPGQAKKSGDGSTNVAAGAGEEDGRGCAVGAARSGQEDGGRRRVRPAGSGQEERRLTRRQPQLEVVTVPGSHSRQFSTCSVALPNPTT